MGTYKSPHTIKSDKFVIKDRQLICFATTTTVMISADGVIRKKLVAM